MPEYSISKFATPPVAQIWFAMPFLSILSAIDIESSTFMPPTTAIHGLRGFSKATSNASISRIINSPATHGIVCVKPTIDGVLR